MNEDDYISRQALMEALRNLPHEYGNKEQRARTGGIAACQLIVSEMPSVNPKEPKTGWNNHQIACMLADMFADTCACNFNGNDEWLSELCDFKDTCCPNPGGVACWEQFLKYSQSRYKAESEGKE